VPIANFIARIAALVVLSPSLLVAGESPFVDIDEVIALGTAEAPDGVATAGQPNAEALKVFRDSGFVAIVDLRGAGEKRGIDERHAVEELGMSYVPLPIEGRDAISFENARMLDRALAEFDGPVLVHCGSGNRAAALLALRAADKGASDDEALELGQAAGLTKLEGVVRERLEDAAAQE
jgi:uncharacterized protein (TIGR01244 family)